MALAQDFGKLLENGENYDIIMKVGTPPNVQEFKAHTAILRVRSSYFDSGLSDRWRRPAPGSSTNSVADVSGNVAIIASAGDVHVLEYPYITPTVCRTILKFVYSGELDRTLSPEDYLAVIEAADQFLLEDVLDSVQDFLIESKASWLVANVWTALETVVSRDTCSKLRNELLRSIAKDPVRLFESAEFVLVSSGVLILLLPRDDLRLEEIKIWEALVRWAKANAAPPITTNVMTWTAFEFNSFNEAIREYMPHIRLFSIPSLQFLDKVDPYNVVPEDIRTELMHYYIKPNYTPACTVTPPRMPGFPIDSSVLHLEHAATIERWIDGSIDVSLPKDVALQSPLKYEWRLLYTGSERTFEYNTFISKVHKPWQLVTVVKVQNSDIIVGGFNSYGWTHISTESLSFSLGHYLTGNGRCLNHSRTSKTGMKLQLDDYYTSWRTIESYLGLTRNSKVTYTNAGRNLADECNINNIEVFHLVHKAKGKRFVRHLMTRWRVFLRFLQILMSICAFAFIIKSKENSRSGTPLQHIKSAIEFLYFLSIFSVLISMMLIIYHIKIHFYCSRQILLIDSIMSILWVSDAFTLFNSYKCDDYLNSWFQCTYYNHGVNFCIATFATFFINLLADIFCVLYNKMISF